MRHHACAVVIGLSIATLLAAVSRSEAASADPTGYWMKPDAERESKIQVFKCGSGNKQLCAKIAWLKEPNDSRGRPLHDARNENPSLRDRPIVGLQLFTGLVPSAPSTWSGKIYNPEDGHTYTATLTVQSRTQILLRGCKAWLLCGEKQWRRTSAPEELTPTTPAEGTEQIEASVRPQAPSTATPDDAMEATPVVAPAAAAMPPSPTPAAQEIASPAAPPVEVDDRQGYRFLTVSTDPDTARLSGENVSSMFVMAKPIATRTPVPATGERAVTATRPQSIEPAPLPATKSKAHPAPVATAAVKPVPNTQPQTGSTEQADAAAQDPGAAETGADGADATTATTAEASLAEPVPMTRRERRLLRKQQRELEREQGVVLPWLQ